MAATFGKMEYRLTVPTGGWTATTGGTASIAAGTYYLSSATDFLTTVGTAFATASGTSCTLTASHGEAGTGIVTVTFGSATAITWVSTGLRDVLGFAGNSSSNTVHTGTLSARGIWMPTCPFFNLNGGGTWRGHMESDFRSVGNKAGGQWSVCGQYHYRLDPLLWNAIKRERVWIENETTVNQSLQRFWIDTVYGDASWATPGGPIRWYPDAANDAVFGTYRLAGGDQFKPEQVSDGWVGLWRVQMPPLVQVPA